MTPSEKKAREILESSKSSPYALEYDIEKITKNVSSALSEAERRGFERAKRMAMMAVKNHKHNLKWVDDLNNGDECQVVDCNPSCDDLIVHDIENLRYEEV